MEAMQGSQEATVLEERLVQAGLKPTRQRVRVLAELAGEPSDSTAQELHRRLVRAGESIGLATIYRTLGALAERGLVDTLTHVPGVACYRLCGEQHHHHLVCSECHRVAEITDCDLDVWLERVASEQGFVATAHHVEVVGVCADCRK